MKADAIRSRGARRARALLPALCAVALLASLPTGARASGNHEWDGIGRVVAVGDLHGDYEQYMKVLRSAGLVNRRGSWTGGDTHLVQTGDVPDRGADTLKILQHLWKLAEQAERKGGRVHTLIGNHEAMNVYGDLRYVTTEEFSAFETRDSERFLELQWQADLERMQARMTPEEWEATDVEALRSKWDETHPPGWVEHRINWIPSGEIGQRVVSQPAIVKVNDTLFMHGGLSAKYCYLSLDELNTMAEAGLADFDPQNPGMVEDPEGLLWYRGLAQDDEAALGMLVTLMLEAYDAERIVIGHTPTGGVVWPRFDGRVIVNDPGIAAYYGAHEAYLELSGGQAIAGYGDERLVIPRTADERIAYLEAVIALEENDGNLRQKLQELTAPEVTEPVPGAKPSELEQEQVAPGAVQPFSPDICRAPPSASTSDR